MQTEEIQKIVNTEEYRLACRAESLAYLCYSVGNQAREQADSYLAKVGLRVHDIKFFANQATKAFDRYHNCVKDTIRANNELIEDYEKIRKTMYVFAGLEKDETK